MRNSLLAIVAIAGAVSAPIAAYAQSGITTGLVRSAPVAVDEDVDGIAVDQRPAFRQYIIREHVPEFNVPGQIVVGGVLPDNGVTYYDVPQTFGATPIATPSSTAAPFWSSRARAASFRWSSKSDRDCELSGGRHGDRAT